MLNALCIHYTAAYRCDLMTDRMELVKRKAGSHAAQAEVKLRDPGCYSEWVRYSFDHFVVQEESPDYLEVFDAGNLMKRLETEDSFVYPHKTRPNDSGMEYFEATAVRLYASEDSFQVIIGYRPIDDLIAEERKRQALLEDEVATLRNIHEALGSGAWKLQYDRQGEMTACRWSDTMRHMLGFVSKEEFPDDLRRGGTGSTRRTGSGRCGNTTRPCGIIPTKRPMMWSTGCGPRTTAITGSGRRGGCPAGRTAPRWPLTACSSTPMKSTAPTSSYIRRWPRQRPPRTSCFWSTRSFRR